MTLTAAGASSANPAAATGTASQEFMVRPVTRTPVPVASSSGQRMLSRGPRISEPGSFANPGSTIASAKPISGRRAKNAHRQPTVVASSEPKPGPRSPGMIHIAESSARIRARPASG